MIVKPRKKHKKLKSNEIRIINIDCEAIAELLWENLMEHQEIYFDVDPLDDDLICQMDWDQKSGILTYAVMPLHYIMEGKKLNNAYIRKKVGVTTNSIFQLDRYRRIAITERMLLPD